MSRKKDRKPCNVCKGKNKHRCLICGWKLEPKKICEMTDMEYATLKGLRARFEFLHQLDRMSTRAGNSSTNWEPIDLEVSSHREAVLEIYRRVKIKKEDPREVGKSLQLTEKTIKIVVQMVSDRIVRGTFKIEPNPQTPVPPKVEVVPPIWYNNKSIFQVPTTASWIEPEPEPDSIEDWGSRE